MAKLICALIFSCAVFYNYNIHAIPSLSRNEVINTTSTLIEATANNVEISKDYVNTHFGWLKLHHSNSKNWNDARTTCLDEGAHLAVINSRAKEEFLFREMSYLNVIEIWTGLHELYRKDDWMTVRGQRLDDISYVHWVPGEPNNAGGNEHCVVLDVKKNGLNDRDCGSTLSFACEM